MIQLQTQPTYPVTEDDQVLIIELREKCKDVLTEFFDTDFNLLRWIIGWKRDLNVVEPKLRKHLLLRKQLNFDVPDDQLPLNHVVNKYFPEMWVNTTTGKTDSVLSVVMDGRVDSEGLLKSIGSNDFALSRLCYAELELRRIMRLEAQHNRRFTVSVIADTEGIKLDSWTWTAIKDVYLHAMPLVFHNYVELVDLLLILNAGRVAYMVWKVFANVFPQSTASKVKILGGNWRSEMHNYFTEESLPVFFGGNIEEDNDRFAYKKMEIPIQLHYDGNIDVIRPEMLNHVTLGHGECHVFTIALGVNASGPFHFKFHFTADGVIAFTVYFSVSPMEPESVIKTHCNAHHSDVPCTTTEQVYPLMHLCRHHVLPDKGIVPPQSRNGYYHFLIKNEAWMFSRTVDYFIGLDEKLGKEH